MTQWKRDEPFYDYMHEYFQQHRSNLPVNENGMASTLRTATPFAIAIPETKPNNGRTKSP